MKRRDFTLVVMTALTAGGLVALAQSERVLADKPPADKKPAMTSTAIEWNSIDAKANANGGKARSRSSSRSCATGGH